MTEPLSNVGATCPHVTHPQPRYLSMPDERFVGCFVKRGFQVLDHEGVEHCWIEVRRVIGPAALEGTLSNDPLHNIGAAYGDPVEVRKSEIEAALDHTGAEF